MLSNPAQKVTNNLDQGFFFIQGSELARLSIKQGLDWADVNIRKVGFGYPDCYISLWVSLIAE